MGDGCNVFDHIDIQSRDLQCTDSGFSALTGTLYIDLNSFQTMFHCSLSSGFGSHLSGKGSGFLGTFESEFAGGSPRKCITVDIGNGYDGIVVG